MKSKMNKNPKVQRRQEVKKKKNTPKQPKRQRSRAFHITASGSIKGYLRTCLVPPIESIGFLLPKPGGISRQVTVLL